MQAPFILIDAPKPVTESRIGSGHPGKPILYVGSRRATGMPGSNVVSMRGQLIETTAFRIETGFEWPYLVTKVYKIPQKT